MRSCMMTDYRKFCEGHVIHADSVRYCCATTATGHEIILIRQLCAQQLLAIIAAVSCGVQEAADRLQAERVEWDAGQGAREQTIARAEAVTEREEALRRDGARQESKVLRPFLPAACARLWPCRPQAPTPATVHSATSSHRFTQVGMTHVPLPLCCCCGARLACWRDDMECVLRKFTLINNTSSS